MRAHTAQTICRQIDEESEFDWQTGDQVPCARTCVTDTSAEVPVGTH